MDKNPDPKLGPLPSVDETRRRLTKAGLAAPAVLGALASRPVLGQSLHNCTPSGHISGFASPPAGNLTCSSLGKPPTYYLALTNWPSFFTDNGDPLPFNAAPASGAGAGQFVDAYWIVNNGGNKVRSATVMEVLVGKCLSECQGNRRLAVADNYSDAGFVLGQEAIAACMNAVSGYPVSFPISAKGVVDMFNNVIGGGTDPVTATANWTAGEVIYYFQSLHP